jgi:uncharacterized membrane protein YphA (DoxX/SURF4 family)
MNLHDLLLKKPLIVLIRIVLGGVFVYGGAIKILEPGDFAAAIFNYRILPREAVNIMAITLPWIEVMVGLMLVMGFWVRTNAILISGLLVVFIIAIAQALARDLNIDCGCFGTSSGRHVGLKAIGWDLLMMVGSVWLVFRAND